MKDDGSPFILPPSSLIPPPATSQRTKRLLWAALVLTLIAAAISATMAIKGPALPGCGTDSGCDKVTSSRWAWWWQIPVAALGAALYVGMAGLLVRAILRPSKWNSRALLVSATVVLASVAWFVAIQAIILKGQFCQYCMADHAIGAAAAILIWIAYRQETGTGAFWLAAPSALAVAILIGGQSLLEPPLRGHKAKPGDKIIVDTPATNPAQVTPTAKVYPPRQVQLLGGRLEFDPQRFPLLGEPDADRVIVEVFDYTCPHCRAFAPSVEQARARYGHKLAMVVFPFPLNTKCNAGVQKTDSHAEFACEYARLALAVWRTSPARFAEYHDWMFQGETPPAVADARKRAEDLVGRDALSAALATPDLDKPIQVAISICRQDTTGNIPKLIVDDEFYPQPHDAEALFKLLEMKLGITPK